MFKFITKKNSYSHELEKDMNYELEQLSKRHEYVTIHSFTHDMASGVMAALVDVGKERDKVEMPDNKYFIVSKSNVIVSELEYNVNHSIKSMEFLNRGKYIRVIKIISDPQRNGFTVVFQIQSTPFSKDHQTVQ